MNLNPKEKDMKDRTNTTGKMPTRIQRSRKPGSKLPPNTICVNRGTKWGNPYRVEKYGRERAIELFRECILNNAMCYYYFNYLEAMKQFTRFKWMSEHLHLIREADHVACFCPLDVECHGDVLIEISQIVRDI